MGEVMALEKVKIDPSWKHVLAEEFQSDYMHDLKGFLKQQYDKKKVIYPKGNEYFSAFNSTPFDKVKVVIIGQDPYHGPGQAHGLCFSVRKGVRVPPSLVNIYKELKSDLGVEPPDHGYLQSWADQGVLLLNATLTVQAHRAGSHQGKGWEKFTDQVIELLSDQYENIVFLLWGGYAKQKLKLIDGEKHCILTSGHPSPLSANRGYWFGNSHFSKTNDYLASKGKEPIDWAL